MKIKIAGFEFDFKTTCACLPKDDSKDSDEGERVARSQGVNQTLHNPRNVGIHDYKMILILVIMIMAMEMILKWRGKPEVWESTKTLTIIKTMMIVLVLLVMLVVFSNNRNFILM